MRFSVESSTKFVLYNNDSVRTKRVCNPWKVCKSVKNFGPKKESEFFPCPLLIKDFSFGQAVSMNGRNPTDQ